MRGRGKASKVPKKNEKKWDTGDLDDKDAELFKHLPSPGEITGGLNTTKELPKVRTKRPKKRVKNG